MAKRLTHDEWIAARIAWESDPTMTGAQLAEAVGISRQSVNERMKRDAAAGDPWEKKVTRAQMAERAMAAADKQLRPEPPTTIPPALSGPTVDEVTDAAAPGQEPGQDAKPDAKPDSQVRKPDAGTLAPDKKPQDVLPVPDPVQARAEVINRHRREWSVSRGLVGEAVGKRDFERAKLAKITSETLSIIQKGERAAWGLDAADPADKPVVIIERSGGDRG